MIQYKIYYLDLTVLFTKEEENKTIHCMQRKNYNTQFLQSHLLLHSLE